MQLNLVLITFDKNQIFIVHFLLKCTYVLKFVIKQSDEI